MALDFKKQLAIKPEGLPDIVNEIQDSLLEVVRKLNLEPLISGVFKQDVALTTTASLVLHDLGFEPRGWLVLNKQADFEIYEDTSVSNPERRRFLALRTNSGSYTVNLYIF